MRTASGMERAACGVLILLAVVSCPTRGLDPVPPTGQKQVVTPPVFCTDHGDCTSEDKKPPCAESVNCNTQTNECEFESKCSANEVCDNDNCCASIVNQACGSCGTGKYNCQGQCIEGSCCTCPPDYTRGDFFGRPDPNGTHCIVRKSTPGGAINLAGLQYKEIKLFITSLAPPGCETHDCGARVILGSLTNCPPNDTGAALFRCDDDVGGESSQYLWDLKNYSYTTPGDGPQFSCKKKLDILSDKYTSNCLLQIDEVVWFGGYFACR